MKIASVRIGLLACVLGGAALAVEEPVVRARLQALGERKPAPEFQLRDSAGKSVSIQKLRGKIVLLDFWATWCTGCKKEIPWFVEFQQKYGSRGFTVVGVSMDDGGWKIVKAFLADTKVPYRMLLGDERTAKSYGIDSLPDTFLIDRQGRIAAAYASGLVDRDNVEANIQALISGR